MTGEELKAIIAERIERDPRLRKIRARISKGRATKADSFTYSRICSGIMSEELAKAVLDLDDREGICAALLRGNYEEIMQTADAIQRSIDEKQGIHMQPRRPAFPAERVQQIAHSLVDPTVPDEKIVRRAGSTATVSMSFHDDFVQENAAFRARAGLKCWITRETDGSCCKWCSALAGRYEYGEEPEEVYHRHDNCGCSVTYENGRQRQDVWSKRTWEAPAAGAGAKEPARLTPEQAAAKEAEHLPKRLTPGRNPAIIKSIDVDDFETVTHGKGISKDVGDIILDTMRKCEKNGGFIISEISTEVTPTSTHGTPVLQIEPLPNGLLQLNINAEFLSGKTLAEVDECFRVTESTIVDSLVEAVIHESGHAIAISGKTVQEITELYKELKSAGLPGVSDIALADGAECLAELEVLRHRGTKVSQELADFYRKYMGRKY